MSDDDGVREEHIIEVALASSSARQDERDACLSLAGVRAPTTLYPVLCDNPTDAPGVYTRPRLDFLSRADGRGSLQSRVDDLSSRPCSWNR